MPLVAKIAPIGVELPNAPFSVHARKLRRALCLLLGAVRGFLGAPSRVKCDETRNLNRCAGRDTRSTTAALHRTSKGYGVLGTVESVTIGFKPNPTLSFSRPPIRPLTRVITIASPIWCWRAAAHRRRVASSCRSKNSVVEGMVNATPVRALCGKVWVPGRDPAKYPALSDVQGDSGGPRLDAAERLAPSWG